MNVEVEVVGIVMALLISLIHPVIRFAKMEVRVKKLESEKDEIVESLHDAIRKFETLIQEQQKYCQARSIDYAKVEQELHQQRVLLMEVRQDLRALHCHGKVCDA